MPEGRHIFPSLTVLENLEMGGYTIDKKEVKNEYEKIFDVFPILKDRKKQRAGTLSSGERQMLALGRALMVTPELLLVDEPSLGLSPNYVDIVFQKIAEINKCGTTILVVEQNAKTALEYAHRGYIFEFGKIAFEGQAIDLLQNEDIQKSFLGGE